MTNTTVEQLVHDYKLTRAKKIELRNAYEACFPSDPLEWLAFIEAYALWTEWKQADSHQMRLWEALKDVDAWNKMPRWKRLFTKRPI